MNRSPLSNPSRRTLFARNLLVGSLLVVGFAFVISWISIPARRASGAIVSTSAALTSPQPIVVQRTALVDPMKLEASAFAGRPHPRPLRMRDPVAYRKMKAALATGWIVPQVPSLLSMSPATTPAMLSNFIGLAAEESCGTCEPPDTQVAAGPDHVFEVDNVEGRIFDKSGNVLQSLSLNGLFNLDAAIFTSDPRIRYDTISGRWLISILSLDSSEVKTAKNGQFNLAVSTSSDPTQPFNVYTFSTPGSFPDQPSLGFNDDKVVTGGNSFSCNPNCDAGSEQGNEFVVWNKADLISANQNVSTDFFPPPQDASDLPIMPAKSRSSTATLFMATAANGTETVWSLAGVPGVGGGTSATATQVAINSLNVPPNAMQKGSNRQIDTGDSRLLDAVFRDGRLWTSATSSCKPAGDSALRSCLRFIEILTSSLSVNQDFDFGTKGSYDYYPSLDLDNSDNLLTSFSQSASNEFASAFVAARFDSDPINTLSAPVLFKSGLASYVGTRWGDYSGAGLDPADESVIWLAAEYSAAGESPNWGTWIADARVSVAPTPTPTATPTPTGRMHLSTNHIDFGEAKLDSIHRLPLKVRNSGQFGLQVTIGQLTAPFGVDNSGTFEIPKGHSTTAMVTFQPTAAGTASQTLVVTGDDPKHPSKNVRVSGVGK